MAQASRSGSLPPLVIVPPLRAQPGGTGEEQWERRRTGALRGEVHGWPGGTSGGTPWWPTPAGVSEDYEADAAAWRRGPAGGGPIPPALQRLRAVLLRLHREREQLLQARNCACHLQAAVRLMKTLSPGSPSGGPSPLPQWCRDLQLHPSQGAVLRIGLGETLEQLLLARPIGLAAQCLEAVIEMQLRALGREPASPGLSSQLAELLLALPAYHTLQGKTLSHVPGAARPFPTSRVLRLLTGERGCQVASQLDEALRGSGLRDQLRRRCHEERDLLPGLLGLVGGVAGSASCGLRLGGAGALWSQYWTLLWAACAQSLDLNLGPWRDLRATAQQLSQALGQGFCQALGSALGGQSSLPTSSRTAELLQQLFPPLLDALREPRLRLIFCQPADPAPVALGLCTLQTTLLWFLGRAQQYLAAWDPASFLLLIQKDLPPLLHEAEALSSLASEESLALEVEQQLGLEIQKLTAQIQLLPEESLSLFSQECHKQAMQGFKLYMPRGRYWRLHLCPELPSAPSEYAGLVVRTVLEPVLQGLQGLPPQAQAPALGQALTAIVGAWLDHILTHGIRFSLQGALQLRQDFGVIRELLEEEQWSLTPDLRQTLLMLSIFQQLDGALLCLLQQPLPKSQVHRRPPCCCSPMHCAETTSLLPDFLRLGSGALSCGSQAYLPADGRKSLSRRSAAIHGLTQCDTSACTSSSGVEVTMAAALARLGLRPVKEVRVQFCPFEKNVESTRTFLQAVSSEKVRSTNLNCSVIADVRHDGSDPCVDVLFGDGHRLIMRGAHLTAVEMLTAFASHIRARDAAGSADKPGADTSR
ncbi:PREDICTED: coiled-coil domain-containing protein 142 isoform X2 [Cercocebus atys]|uniref:coiled-coil domain-containing protein 142 isoform X2 n=1 Tax=Cercocebus atys TaxID=9531 RepID=UPI0005F41C3C|nr:PREDICTED: coiled-coil domain-containing protein 142 isoform X2 [Cercocebus atys]